MTGPQRRPVRPGLLGSALIALPLALVPSIAAGAAWSTPGSGSAGAAATVMPTGLAPAAVATRNVVTVTWPAVTLPDGTPVDGYTVMRTNAATGVTGAAGGTCAGIVTTTTCTDSPVPPGSWTYADTPVLASWTGGQSPQSNTVTVPLT